MAKKRINTQDLVNQIEKLARERMSQQPVVSLDQIRDLKTKLNPKVILVIEDDETMRLALQKIIESEGHLVKLAADGTQLAQTLQDQTPDLILIDIGLPWINGFELAELMKNHADLKKIPLIFVSGKSTPEDIKQAFALGADDFIKKPFDIDKLKKSIQVLLKIKPNL